MVTSLELSLIRINFLCQPDQEPHPLDKTPLLTLALVILEFQARRYIQVNEEASLIATCVCSTYYVPMPRFYEESARRQLGANRMY